MAYGVGLRFDETTEKTVTDIWQRLSDLGLMTALSRKGYVPHISMVLSETLKVDAFIEEINKTLEDTPKIQVQFSSVSFFTNPKLVLYYGVTSTETLLRLHTASYNIYQKYASDLNPLYRPNTWVPHCGLAVVNDEDKLKAGIDIARMIPLPLSVPSVEYVIVEHDGRCAEILQSFSL